MTSKIKGFTLFLLGAVLFSVVGAGCNTTRGFGKDVEKLGDKIEKKAR